MYVDIAKFLRVVGAVIALAVLLLGIVLVVLSKTAAEQSAGTLMAIFGLLLAWFMAWLGRS